MAAPLPSGVLQNEHIFLPLTDLDYRKHHLKGQQHRLAHSPRLMWGENTFEDTRIWRHMGMVGWYGLDQWFSNGFVSQAQESINIVNKMSTKMYYGAVTSANFCAT